MKTLYAIKQEIKELNEKEKSQRGMGIYRLLNNEQRKEYDKRQKTIGDLIDTIDKEVEEFNGENGTDYMLDDDCKGHWILRTHTVWY